MLRTGTTDDPIKAPETCTFKGCDKPHNAKGFCSTHYVRFKKHGDPSITLIEFHEGCIIDGCEKDHFGLGYCQMHYNRLKRHGDPNIGQQIIRDDICIVNGCNNEHEGLGYCNKHYQRYIKYGDPLITLRVAAGDGHINKNGYRVFQIDDKHYLEHRLVVERHEGRKLLPYENIHHKNGDRLDNRIENLEIWNEKQPVGQRAEDKVRYAIEILELYASYELATKKEKAARKRKK